MNESKPRVMGLRSKIYEIIFEAETPAGRLFDVLLLVAIVVSLVAVSLESVESVRVQYGAELRWLENGLAVLFLAEFFLRIYSAPRAMAYVFSFFGMVDLISVFPTVLGWFVEGAGSLLVFRALRLTRVFRVLKLARFVREADILASALRSSRHKIIVFLGTVLSLSVILGTLMYVVEGSSSGFTSIPKGIYWAIVTLTTVGYGDIAPQTPMGQVLASVAMIMGYGVIAVPTGIVSVELAQATRQSGLTRTCPHCYVEGHEHDAGFCRRCGQLLDG